jgi:hypothetical protein
VGGSVAAEETCDVLMVEGLDLMCEAVRNISEKKMVRDTERSERPCNS